MIFTEFIYNIDVNWICACFNSRSKIRSSDALQKAGCQKIYHDKISGAKVERTGLAKTLELSRAGDIIVIWRLDRLGRSIKDLIQISETLKERSIGLKSLQEGIDTTTPFPPKEYRSHHESVTHLEIYF